jgi:hypothetical protein
MSSLPDCFVRWSPPRTAELRCNGAGDLTEPYYKKVAQGCSK